MKKRILCYGDSNTHGYKPGGGRYTEEERWPMLLQEMLGSEYTIIEEGFGGRTTVFDDPVEGGYKSGEAYLPPCLMSHKPIDLVILMLGTNDTKQRFQMNAKLIADCNTILINKIRQYGEDHDGNAPRILLVAPIKIGGHVASTDMGPAFGEYAISVADGFSKTFREAAAATNCFFLDASEFADPSPIDAIHFTPEGHKALADGLCAKVHSILG